MTGRFSASIRKAGLSVEDFVITILLLFGTAFLDAAYDASDRIVRDKFSSRIFQHSLIGLFAHNRKNSTLRRIAGWLQCKDLLDGYWRVDPSNSCKEITELVRQHVQSWWKYYIRDTESYKMVNDSRGEWTLASYGCRDEQIELSIRRPFDESIVIWHLATDLYIHHTCTSLDDHVSARQCKEMSNYMVHLLFHNPEMLLPGSRNGLLATAYKELEDLLVGERTLREENKIAQRVFEKCVLTSSGREDADTASLIRDGANTSLIRDVANDSLIRDASELARSLLGFANQNRNQNRIWDLIQGVWVEMLCFSAGRCRGYLHAEALGTGVEYLSYVWVLLAHAGMETFAEKLLKREGQRGRQNAATQFDSSQSEG
ncbi:hypothetical protein QYE76_046931 [Lolium multiflorum]|uniref:DUF4220 domain-containing protein n=1 Tax=Lolium multiflorum TaxID=4521 RepID=A0AAD8TQH1_LOLMU|nr:hypothetical protein QYE76_046931 [Lolium multiflorum]